MTEDNLRRAIIEVAFVHNVTIEALDVEVHAAERFACWGECSTWKGLDDDHQDEL